MWKIKPSSFEIKFGFTAIILCSSLVAITLSFALANPGPGQNNFSVSFSLFLCSFTVFKSVLMLFDKDIVEGPGILRLTSNVVYSAYCLVIGFVCALAAVSIPSDVIGISLFVLGTLCVKHVIDCGNPLQL